MKRKYREEHVKVDPRQARRWLASLLPSEQAEIMVEKEATAQQFTREINRSKTRFNRLVSPPHWVRLARDMAHDHWLYDAQPVRFDVDGVLRDGQHRLLAVIESGRTIEFLVAYDLDPETYFVMDSGRARSIRDNVGPRGVPNAGHVVAVSGLVLRWRAGKLNRHEFSPTVLEIEEFIEKTPEIQDAVADANRVRRALPKAVISVYGAAWIEANTLDPERCTEMFELLYTGDIRGERHPIMVLRNMVIRYDAKFDTRYRQWQKLWHVVRAWNAWRAGETIRHLQTPTKLTSDMFPRMR